MTRRAPRLCKGLAVVTAQDALVVEDGRRRHRFTGMAVTSALDPLLPLMDGRRDEAALALASGLPAGTVRQVVGLLDECGLVEYPQPGPPAAEHVATYFSRSIDATSGYRSAEQLLAVLATSDVVLIGKDPAADRVAHDLTEAGVETVRRHTDVPATMPALVGAGRRAMVVVFDDPDQPQLLMKAVDAAAGAPVLRCGRTNSSAHIGPLFFSGFTACPDCFRRGWQELREGEPEADGSQGWDAGTESAAVVGNLLAGLAGVEVLAVLAGVTEPTSVRRLTTVSVPDHKTQHWLVTPYRDCPKCGKQLTVEGDGAPAEEYEWQMERPPQDLKWNGRPPRSERQRHEALQRTRPEFPLSPRRALPPEETPSASTHPLLPALSRVVRRVAGFRSPSPESTERWTASGGNLGSTEVYVVADEAVFDLPGSVVRYDDLTDEAVAVHGDRVPVARCVEGTGLPPDGVDAVIVLVAATGRLANKYGWFAHRLAHLDAGCAAVSLAAVAAGCDLDASFAAGWPDDLGELLELESGREVVVAVAALRSRQAGV
jgi:bacteriocin biosynthesis cyclodehydratase domain-containing protein